MSKIKNSFLSLACIALLFLSGTASAQLGFSTTRVEVKPGANIQFENFIMQFKAAAEEINWPYGWNASQVAVGNTNQYLFVAPFDSHEQLSTPVTAVLGQAHSPSEVAEILQDLRDSTSSLVTGTYYARDDLSNPPSSPPANQELILTVQVNAKAGMQMQFEEWVKRVVDGSEGVTWNAFAKGFGVGPGYVFRSGLTWAALDQPAPSPQQRVMDAFGPVAGNAIINLGAASMESNITQLLRQRPDLSYSP